MTKPFLLLAATTVLVGSISGEIVPVPGTQSVDAVFAKADLVCNCLVLSVTIAEVRHIERAGRPLTAQHVIARVEVSDLYKAQLPNRQISVEFDKELPSTRASLPELRRGERALMFLSASSSSYVFADPFLGVIPFDDLPRPSEGVGIEKLRTALSAVLELPNRDEQVRALELLEGLENLGPDLAPALFSLTRSSDPEVAMSAFAVLVKINGAPDITEAALTSLSAYLDSLNGRSEPLALVKIGSEMALLGKANGVKSFGALKALSASKFVPIRSGAMQALRAMRNPQTAATLVKRLDDPNGYVRYLAVISLAETFGKYEDYAPSMYLFDMNPNFYVGLWKDWWTAEGKAIPH
jgi:hypothetical protein